MAVLFNGGIFQAINAGGVVPGAQLFTYAAGGLTPLATYTDQGGGSPNSNPVLCDADGQASVYLGTASYRMILKDASAVVIYDVDNVTGDFLGSGGASLIGFLQAGSGAVPRTVQDKLRDTVSVVDFGAKGDGTTDDTAAIQAAVDTRKTVFFPKPPTFYKITSFVELQSTSHLTGEEGVGTIIRNTIPGSVFDIVGGSENPLIENLRLGGAGGQGITDGGGGYTNYLSGLTLRNVHFEADLATGINANLIYLDAEDCTFGYFNQTAANANFQAVVSVHGGGNNTNVNLFTRCKFFNGGTTVDAVHFDNGMILTFVNCDFTNNGRNLFCSNVQNTLLLNCYTEGSVHATSLFDFNQSRGRMKIVGGQYNGGAMPSGSAMFRATDDAPLLVEDADIVTGSAAFTYKSATTSAHLPTGAALNLHVFKDCRISGNASDPLKYLDTTYSAALVPKGWAIINTASSGTIVSSSDPGLGLTRNGTGDVTLTFSTNLATGATTACVIATGQTTYVTSAGASATTCRFKAFNRSTDAAADDIVQVVIWGA
jgi:hypothetical protein